MDLRQRPVFSEPTAVKSNENCFYDINSSSGRADKVDRIKSGERLPKRTVQATKTLPNDWKKGVTSSFSGPTKPNAQKFVVPSLTRRMYFAFYARLAGMLFLSMIIILVLVTLFPVLCIHRRKWRLLSDHMQALWINSLLWMLPPQCLELSGDIPDASMRPKVIICNHQTDVDWIFLWMVARMTAGGQGDRSGNVKIMLKEEVASIPVVGWGCSLFDFIFLKRKWETDQKRIEDKLVRFTKDGQPLWIFLFVEGTTMNLRSLEKSRGYARDSDRPIFERLLLPRARGLEHVLQVLHKHSSCAPEIFDMTMAFESYSGEVPSWDQAYSRARDILVPNFTKLMMGTSSHRIYLESTRFCYKQLCRDQASIEKWLDARWIRKERQLQFFADNAHFNPVESGMPTSVPITGSIWRSLASVCFYISLWAGVCFTYIKYAQEGDEFFSFAHSH